MSSHSHSPDLDSNRLEVAKSLGADHVVKVTTRDSRELSQIITGQLGCEPDQTIECSGAEQSVATAIYVRMKSCTISIRTPLSGHFYQDTFIRTYLSGHLYQDISNLMTFF